MEAEEHRGAGIALIIDALNISLKQLGERPEGPQVREPGEKGLGYINEAILWRDAKPRPTAQMHEALMKKVLALHVQVSKLGRGGPPDSSC